MSIRKSGESADLCFTLGLQLCAQTRWNSCALSHNVAEELEEWGKRG
jgi:hypothetical protein